MNFLENVYSFQETVYTGLVAIAVVAFYLITALVIVLWFLCIFLRILATPFFFLGKVI